MFTFVCVLLASIGYGSQDVSSFLSVKPPDIFQEIFGKIPAIPCVWQQKSKKKLTRSWDISSVFLANNKCISHQINVFFLPLTISIM